MPHMNNKIILFKLIKQTKKQKEMVIHTYTIQYSHMTVWQQRALIALLLTMRALFYNYLIHLFIISLILR